jgi:aspartyl-tRNA synthetase
MVRWAGNLHRETIVYVQGKIQKPGDGHPEIKQASIHEVEISIEKLHVITAPTSSLPFQVEDAGRSLAELTRPDAHYPRIGQTTRLVNRVVDLRTPVSHSIFRLRAGITNLFRTFLDSQGFTEIQSPKLQPAATESGSAVFKVDYFRRPAFLAQSPQLAKQMAIAADMERVYEIGPVFRAENSNTHRHLTEFTGLDLEMAFENNYHEVMDVIDKMFLFIFKGIQSNYRKEIETIKSQYPHEDLLFLDETLKLKFSEGIQMLIDAGYKEDDGSDPSPLQDLTTRAEQTLGRLVREKYHTDYYILDKFPASARPFYTMPDPENSLLSNSYDIFIRGEEVLSGSQRIHDAVFLEKKMREANIDPETMTDYLNGFKWGCPPHGGGGVGLERVVMLMLKLGDVRWASLIPRDPRSFPQKDQPLTGSTEVAPQNLLLHGPESTTFTTSNKPIDGELPLLENLIAKYGDATNTSWIDPAWTVWRDRKTGAAVGYIPQNGFAVTFGNPLCEPKQIPAVVRAYLDYLSNEKLKPVWCCVDAETEKVLANEFGWSALTAVAEERINPTEVDPEKHDRNLRKKLHRAEKSGVKLIDVEGLVDPEVKKEIDERVEDWKRGRKGTQIHLTSVRPWDDEVHRKYFYARDAEGRICAMVVLAQLSTSHGFQVKWALEFPGAPLGAIEYILTHVIKKMGEIGVRSATFGAGAATELHRVDNIGGFKVSTLEKAYNGISSTFHLGNKGDFRSKFGAQQDPLYICYPKGGLGVKGIEAIMKMLQSPK